MFFCHNTNHILTYDSIQANYPAPYYRNELPPYSQRNRALASLIPIQLNPMAEATGMNCVSCSLEPALIKEVCCQYSPPSPSGCPPNGISLNSGTL
ncbi:hypothetical protein DSO57_1037946 [Entomophthora muscae]|uniref:Uncharacterized protein n=1 Tax=Entomophthora muscae TaxID=34485 RepID=A0ACC2TLW8_9FUNG|nr:hypothetical protein DSO57_1037946 [Entomophthora muscae]